MLLLDWTGLRSLFLNHCFKVFFTVGPSPLIIPRIVALIIPRFVAWGTVNIDCSGSSIAQAADLGLPPSWP